MDVVFGSEGVAAQDYERQAEISREIGLDDALSRLGHGLDRPPSFEKGERELGQVAEEK